RPRTRSTTPASCRWRRASSSSDPLPRRPPAAGLLPYRPPAAGLLPYRPPAARSRAGSDMASLNIAYSSPPLIERAAPWRAGPIAAPASCVGKAVGSCSFPALPSVVDELSDETEHGQRREDTQPEDPLAVTFTQEIGSRDHRQRERHAESECRDDVSHAPNPTFEQALL